MLFYQISRRSLLVLLSAGVLVAACKKSVQYSKMPAGSKVLALGDSLTAGYGVNNGEDYPAQLASLTGWEVLNAGVSGDTSAQALARLPEWLEKQPKLVIISIGGNDFLRKLPESETRANIGKMIEMVQAENIPVVLVAIPYFTAGALLGRVSEHELYRDLAKQYNTPLLEGAWADVLGDKDMKSDAIHGNALGYRYFAKQLADFLKKQGFR